MIVKLKEKKPYIRTFFFIIKLHQNYNILYRKDMDMDCLYGTVPSQGKTIFYSSKYKIITLIFLKDYIYNGSTSILLS